MIKQFVSFLRLCLFLFIFAGLTLQPQAVAQRTEPSESSNHSSGRELAIPTVADATTVAALTDEQRKTIEAVVRDSTSQIWFENNVGQFPAGARYGFRTTFGAMLVYDDHLQMLTNQTDSTTHAVGIHTVNMSFDNSNTAWQITPGGLSDVMGAYQNADGTTSHPSIFKELTLRNVYDGIDLRLYSAANGTVEFDWLVARAQDYQKIQTVFTGQDGITYDADGAMTLGLRYQDLTLQMPETYQVINGEKQIIVARMVAGDRPNTMHYQLSGNIVADQPLVIDPTIAWSTYIDLEDDALPFDSYNYAIGVNSNGVYVSGWMEETVTNGSFANYMEVNAGFSEGTAASQNYVYRLNNTGTNITAWTSTGRVNNDSGVANQKIDSATNDAAADLELFPDGRVLVGFASGVLQIYSANLSTRSYNAEPITMDTLNAVAIVSDSSFYASGRVTAATSVASVGPDATFAGAREGIIIRYTFAGTTPTADWASYIGGNADEYFTAIALTPDKSKLVFATTAAAGAAYPGLVNAVDNTIAGTELLVGVLPEQATVPAAFSVFSYLGDAGNEGTLISNTTAAVVTATNSHFYVAGNSVSATLPGITGGAQAANGGGNFDVFVSRIPLNGSAGTGFQSTFLGGANEDNIGGIAFDAAANQLLVFGTTGGGFPVLDTTPASNYYDGTFGGNTWDIFVAILDNTLATKSYATYIGGTQNDYLGQTGDLIGQGHVTYSSATGMSYLATTVHSTLPANAIGTPPGKDDTKSNGGNDSHTVFAFNINSYDYGDAPLTYDNGGIATAATSAISTTIRIGTTVDVEAAPVSSANALGDDNSNTGSTDDEDGVAALATLNVGDTTYSQTVSVLNNSGGALTLQGWIDFNGNGTFDASEYTSVSVPTNAAQQNATLTWSGMPVLTAGQQFYVRLRFNNGALTDNVGTASIDERSIGVGGSGEVEDYLLTVAVGFADLAVTKTNGVASVGSGGTTTYTLTLVNNGPNSANNATLSDPVSASGLTKTAIGACTASGGAVCPTVGAGAGEMNIANLEASTVIVPTLPNGGSISFTVTASVSAAGGNVTNTFSVTPPSGVIDSTPGNNSASDTDTVTNLVVTKSSSAAGTVNPGDTITYTLNITNNSSVTQNNLVVTDALPTGTTYVTQSTLATMPVLSTSATYLDQFTNPAFDGSFGTANWAGTPWTETNDDGVANTGKIQIDNASANVARFDATAAADVLTLTRPVDLTGVSVATLTYALTETGNNAAADTVVVQVSSNGGTTWNTLTTQTGNFTTFNGNHNLIAPTNYANANTQIRFVVTGFENNAGCGGAGNNCDLRLDNVQIAYTIPAGTLTKDNAPAGINADLTSGVPATLVTAADNFDLQVGQTMTVTYQVTVNNPVVGGQTQVVNTVSVTSVETTTAAQATVTDNINSLQADLAITKTDGVAAVDAGGTTTYTLTLTNNGPSAANNSTLSDPAVAGLTKTAIGACTAAGGAVCPTVGAGAGQMNITNLEAGTVVVPTLPNGGSLSFTVTADVTATNGTVANTFTSTPPVGTTDPTPATVTDTDNVNPIANLVVTKTDSVLAVDAGGTTTYTLTLTNNGPSAANNSTLSDPAVAGLTKTAIGACTPAGGAVCPTVGVGAGQMNSANLEAGTVVVPTLPNGGSISFTVTANVTATSGTVANTFTSTPPGGTTDPTPATVTDTDNVNPIANLVVTKTDGVAAVDAGGTTTYTLTLTNNGPSAANNATLSDPAVAGLTKTAIGACTPAGGAVCPTVGVGAGEMNIANLEAGTVVVPTLPNGGSLSFTVTANVTATNGTVANTFASTPPVGTTDPTPATVTDTDNVNPIANLVVTKTDGVTNVQSGTATTYTLTLTNNGPSAANNATLSDPAVAGLTKTAVGACTPVGGAVCPTVGAGAGQMNITNLEAGTVVVPTLPNGGSISFTVTANVTAPSGTVVNTFTSTPPVGTTDPTPATTTDTDTVIAINAVNDTGATVDGTAGGQSFANVLTNDTLNANPATLANITLTQVSTTNAGVTLNPLDGSVNVAPGTLAGNYTVTYQICDQANPTFCDTATVSVPVVVIDAVNDTGASVNGYTGGQSFADVLINDTLNGNPATLANITLTQVSTTNAGVTLNPVDGSVNVAAGTPAGNYTVTYQICDQANPTICDTATVSVPVTAAPINAVDDSAVGVNGLTGATNVLDVFTNDTLNGVAIVPAQVTLTQQPGGDPELTLNANGSVDVAPNTPAGIYTLSYQICDILNPTNCDNATVTITVVAAPIVANDDDYSATPINGYTGGNAGNAFTNDTLNGVAVNVADITATITTPASNPGVTMNIGTGTVTVAAGTPAGTYTIDYQICENLNPTNCDPATITVVVSAAPIVANDDSAVGVNGLTGATNVLNVFTNDTLNGVAVIPAEVTLTQQPGGDPELTLNPNGSVDVAPNTPAGIYTLSYQICEILNPTNCDIATVTITVVAAPIVANDDNYSATPINGYTGGNAGNAFTNDTLSGVAVNVADITATITTPASNPGVTMNTATGAVTVAAGTPAGTYTLDYQICEILNPTNCDTATVTITVVAAPIVANDDNYSATPINGYTGGSAGNAFANDTLNGVAVNPANITATITTPASNPGVTMNTTTGAVTVAAGTPAGTYTIDYQICENLNITNCDPATITVVVSAAPIVANDDSAVGVNGLTGAINVLNVFTNDTLNGVAVVPAQVTLTQQPGGDPELTLNANGSVDVAPNTPAGIYTLNYQICEILNPTNCDIATVTITVVAAPIVANDDDYSATPINGYIGGNAGNAFTNDTLNGVAVNVADITATITTPASNPGVTLNTGTGAVTVAAGTPAGTYTIDYQICENLNPTNCDPATITVVVNPPVINAVDDSAVGVNGRTGATNVLNVFTNDTVNGVAVVPAQVTLTQQPGGAPELTLNPNGSVDVAPNTPAGIYTLDYQICEILNPTNCDIATVTVTVVAAPIVANDDDYSATPINGYTGGNAGNAFTNDTLNGVAVNVADITGTITTPASNPGVTMNIATGAVTVAAGTPAGTYTIDYQICENLNPTNCDPATITVVVVPAVINAVNDSAVGVNGRTGATNVLNVFTNDTLNGVAVVPAQVTLTQQPGGAPELTLNPNGSVDVAPNTPAGIYTLDYQICELLNPTNCDIATVTITVVAAPIVANDDNYSATPINGFTGGNAGNAFTNDTLNGVAVNVADITATITTPASNPGVTLNTGTGAVTVAPNTPAGTYTIDYQICENLNPTNCDPATITVVVAPAVINAVNDSAVGVNGLTGATNVLNVFTNDTLNGVAVVPAQVTLTQQPGGAPELTLNPNGSVDVAPNTPAGIYTLDYQICEILNPTNCDIATVTITVVAAPIVANDDDYSATPINGYTGGNAGNAFTNDTLNGVAVNVADITATVTASTSPNVALNTGTGAVTVAAGTPAGTYTIDYQICENLNPTNCDPATITVVVNPAVINAVDDSAVGVNGLTGATNVLNVFTNDTLNGVAVVPAQVTLTQQPGGAPELTLNPNGSVDVAPNTPAGIYTLSYQICEILNPTNCDIATVTITVNAAVINAVDDTGGPVSGLPGATNVLNVFTNDTLNGVAVIPAQVTLTQQPGGAPELTLNPNGSVDVAPNTPAGIYTLDYQICENLNPTNCDIATVTITVVPVAIVAVDDDYSATPVNGYTGGSAGNAFTNDTLNGVAVNAADITATITTPASNPGVAMNPVTGAVTVAAGTPAGTYTIDYQICENLNPTNCDPATITVVVNPPVINAVDDSASGVNGITGEVGVLNVFDNDTLNGVAVVPAEVTLTETVADPSGALTLNPDGSVDVAPGTAAGTYQLTYEICEVLNPTNCDTAVVSVTVGLPPAPTATDDSTTTPFNTPVTLPNITTNDTAFGAGNSIVISTIDLDPTAGQQTSFTDASGNQWSVNTTTGDVTFTPGLNFTGVAAIPYTVQDAAGQTATANLSVTVAPPASISGVVFHDLDLNGSKVASEPGIVGVIVNLYDSTGVTLIASTTTGAGGTYSFPNLTAGNYRVVEIDPAGYVSSTANSVPVTLVAGGSGTADFGDYQLPNTALSSISGVVFNDANANGVQDGGETSLSNVTVELKNNLGIVIATATTNASGAYNFTNLSAGTYTVVETDLPGYVSTTLNNIAITLSAGTNATLNYGDQTVAGNPLIADPAVTKLGSPTSAVIGDTVVYTITVGNNGNTNATGVVLTDTKPAFLDIIFVSISPNPGLTPVISGNTFTINFGTVTPTDFFTITVLTRVNAQGVPPGGVNNAAIVTNSGTDRTVNNASSALLSIPSTRGGVASALPVTALLPATGFAPNAVTSLPAQPSNMLYAATDLLLEIPRLGVKMPIVGVAKKNGAWDVTWLGKQAGWLEGTAFPSWNGNSVLTGHVYDSNGLPGPFVNLSTLKYGDKIIVHAYGQKYTFEIRTNQIVAPNDISVLKHEEKAWLTLVTCKEYDEKTNTYKQRVVVRAILVSVDWDK